MIGGILSIISGVFGFLGVVICVLAIIMFTSIPIDGASMPDKVITAITIVYAVIGFLFLLVGVLAMVGGAFSIRRKNWPLALAGSIAGTITFLPCGIPAIIFTTLAKPDFDRTNSPAPVD